VRGGNSDCKGENEADRQDRFHFVQLQAKLGGNPSLWLYLYQILQDATREY
jgi:hypothetical protein